ncbi:hypothetical protein JYU34_021112 [Plutella xylostella]|uniref:Retrotransposon gag domain-containing protein n=1 Tax=Plutella xylostella TaxID=51655 RepID=A0ABQ7PSR5_PLUXY|nr:hypothetical protein JYU34_021112 [Plutella xylostella]
MSKGGEEVPSGSKGAQVREEKLSETDMNVELNVLLKFIKPFDGSREKLNSFILNCQNAHNLATKAQKPILFRYILSQLEGKAESICSIKEFASFDQFTEFLKQQFGERKHYAHLLSELQECKQTPSESVNQYALKIETCLAKLLTEINISIPTKRKTELTGRVAAMEDLALHTFVIGLHPRLSQIVRCRDPDSLNSAVNFAVAEEKILLSLNKSQSRPQFNNTVDKPRFTPRRDFQQRSYQPNFPQNRPDFSRDVPTCRYCKNPGHTIENCRKRQYNNRNQFHGSSSQGRQNNQSFSPSAGPSRRVFTISDDQGVDEVDNHDLNE